MPTIERAHGPKLRRAKSIMHSAVHIHECMHVYMYTISTLTIHMRKHVYMLVGKRCCMCACVLETATCTPHSSCVLVYLNEL